MSLICNNFVALQKELRSRAFLSEREPLASKTTFQVGGMAAFYIEPFDNEALATAIAWAQSEKMPHFVLGRGSNVWPLSPCYEGLVIRLNHAHWQTIESIPDRLGCVRVGGGVRLKALCGFAQQAGLGGFEFLEGIPGTVGGALKMNAGAMGSAIDAILDALEVITPTGQRLYLKREDLTMNYRSCPTLDHCLVTSAVLKSLASVEPAQIAATIADWRAHRRKTQPREPSSGCTFKNPCLPDGTRVSAGSLIDRAGLKGLSVGRAQVSPVHANFMINTGGVTPESVISLMEQIQARVFEKFDVYLQTEVVVL